MAADAGAEIRIRYHRPPDRLDVFVNRLVHRRRDVIVTLMDSTPLKRPMRIAGEIVLEDRSPVVWFTFPGAAHDIGRFHRADGRFSGIYANVLTPVVFHDEQNWETTDLFLDVWIGADGTCSTLDRAELEHAALAGWIDAGTADAARAEAARLTHAAAAGEWPPPVVYEWTLEKARERMASGTSTAFPV